MLFKALNNSITSVATNPNFKLRFSIPRILYLNTFGKASQLVYNYSTVGLFK